MFTLTNDQITALKYEVETFKRDHRGEVKTTALWDSVVANNPGIKRADAVKMVLVAADLWTEEPQKKDGKRTQWGTVVQKMGARFDLAVKRAAGAPTPAETDYLAAVIKSVESAIKHDIDAARVLEAAQEYIASLG